MLSTHHSHSLHYDSTLIDKIIVFETNFVPSLAILQHSLSFWQQNLARLNDDSPLVTASIFFFKFMQLVTFCFKLQFIYADIGSMWVFGYPYILHFVLHGLNSMRPCNMYMHFWNDVIAGLDSGLLTIVAKALYKPMSRWVALTLISWGTTLISSVQHWSSEANWMKMWVGSALFHLFLLHLFILSDKT